MEIQLLLNSSIHLYTCGFFHLTTNHQYLYLFRNVLMPDYDKYLGIFDLTPLVLPHTLKPHSNGLHTHNLAHIHNFIVVFCRVVIINWLIVSSYPNFVCSSHIYLSPYLVNHLICVLCMHIAVSGWKWTKGGFHSFLGNVNRRRNYYSS